MSETLYSVTISKDGDKILCLSHKLETCTTCSVDWAPLNSLAISLKSLNGDTPPPNAHNAPRNAQVSRLREEGNKHFKKNEYAEAVRYYTMAVELSWSRPLWEPMAFQFVREELAPVLSNRAAAYTGLKLYVEALVDADIVTKLRKDWSKGWFRKGKALIGMKRLDEAVAAFEEGLEYEPDSEELRKAIAEVDKTAGKNE
ncbi:hypothetical protein BC936DRAFT_145748 [Jimgerdemannia flammicorona]|uniref:Uncharacterized protein n=2 Tax=Jimgerdemannia flammicorona TaxID=994334 RepID=A0A433QJK8_9FUNG|nr:hypothetical protein BC936DRAFT_145748 [Jimgerdemannia flammicorona]RUS29955.1 hypothetical protein BC938DRAFT_480015 [Jimgerdemannia flammicorona]